MPARFRVLVVCTGNICRSAQAQQFVRARIAEGYPELESVVVVESAGTRALVGSPMPEKAAKLSAHYGGNPKAHSARQLTVDQLRAADLVLGMTAEHRSAAVRLLPRASRITFTLTEFAALLESAAESPVWVPEDWSALRSADKLRSGIRLASARRGYLSGEDAAPVDVIDPYRRAEEVYEESAQQIIGALDRSQRAAVRLAEQVGS